MIKEEAIEILSDMRAEYNIFSDDEEEATRYHALSWAIQALNERTGRWIPVSERLPEDGSEVWATIKGSDVIKVEAGETIEQAIDRVNRIRWVTRAYWSEEEHGWNDPTFGCPLVVQPIAWMPIEKPEPYKEEQK